MELLFHYHVYFNPFNFVLKYFLYLYYSALILSLLVFKIHIP